MEYTLSNLIERYPVLEPCRESIDQAHRVLTASFAAGHKLLVAGNGGSCADAEHIVGELMKGFVKARTLPEDLSSALRNVDPVAGEELAKKLQLGLPAIALHSHPGLSTAFINDVPNAAPLVYAQQLLTYGQEGDVFLGISTSGNAENVYNACVAAKAKGMKVIGLTGKTGGKLAAIADVAIVVPCQETFAIQELHLPIYHYLCLAVEADFFA